MKDDHLARIFHSIKSIKLDSGYTNFLHELKDEGFHYYVLSSLGMNLLINPGQDQYRSMVHGHFILYQREDVSYRIYYVPINKEK